MRAVLSRGALLVAAIAVSLLIFEIGLRAVPEPCEEAFFPWLVFDPELGWRNAPPSEAVRCGFDERALERSRAINEHGFRGPPIGVRKAEGKLRIISLGDSATFGVRARGGEPDPEIPLWQLVPSYVGELARILQAKAYAHVEVINSGAIGYSSSHGLRLLNARMLEFEPDIVTVRFGANDAKASWATSRRVAEPRNPVLRWLLYRFHGSELLRLSLRAYQNAEALHPMENAVPWVAPAEFRRNLERFAEIAREHEFHLLLIDYSMGAIRPNLADVRVGLEQLQQIQREFAAETGAELLSTTPELVPIERYFAEHDSGHPSDAGARKIGELLFERLDALGWLQRDQELGVRQDWAH